MPARSFVHLHCHSHYSVFSVSSVSLWFTC
jgi:hypothetical protein